MGIELTENSVDLLDGRVSVPRALLDRSALGRSGRAVFLAGSLIEGLGNQYSDLDVYSVGENLPALSVFSDSKAHRLLSPDRHILRPQDMADSPVFLAHVIVDDTPVKVDVEFRTYDDVYALAGRLKELHAYAAANLVLLTRRFAPREEDFIMRLLGGYGYAGGVDALRSAFDLNQFLYLAYRWLASDFGVLLDLIGAWKEGDLEVAVDIARENAISQMQAYLHLHGMVSLRRKWLLKFVDRLLAHQPDVAARFKSIFVHEGLAPSDDSRKAYVFRTLEFVEDIYARSEALLIANGTAPVGEEARELLAHDRDISDSLYADLEYEYRAKVYGRAGRPLRSYLEAAL